MKSSFQSSFDASSGSSSNSSRHSRSPSDHNNIHHPRYHSHNNHQQTSQSSIPYRPSSYAQSNRAPTPSQVTRTFTKKSIDNSSGRSPPSSTSIIQNLHATPSSICPPKPSSRSNSSNNSPHPHSESQSIPPGNTPPNGDHVSDVPVPISEKSRYDNFVKEKSEAEVVSTLKGLDVMLRRCMSNEKEAKKKQNELNSEVQYWKLKYEELERREKEEEKRRVEEGSKRNEKRKFELTVERQKLIEIKSAITKDDKSGAVIDEDSVKSTIVAESFPVVSGLPPISRFPGQAPPPPKREIKVKPKKGLFGMPNLTDMLLKRVHKGKENDDLPVPKRPQHNRIQFYWVGQAQGSPCGVSQLNDLKDLVTSTDVNHPLNEQLPFSSDPEAIARSVESQSRQRLGQLKDSLSVYSVVDPSEMIDILSDKKIEECFTKKKPETVKKIKPTTAKESVDNSKRPSVLGPAASQKYHITVRCFSKAFDGWEGFKHAILQCRLDTSQINLLLETIPDPDSLHGSRKLQEWEELVQKVEEFRMKNPLEDMYEDEAFVHYISTIPNLHQRLQCMNIMNSFNDLLTRFHSEIDLTMDALEMLLKNKEIPKLFHAILSVGNFLNEGTNIADKKWFRLGSLKKVAEFKGAGREAKSLLYFLASRLGPILTSEQSSILQKASQVSIVQIVQNVLNIGDIFKLLSEQGEDQPKTSILSKKRRNSILPGQDDSNDRFAEVGREFVRSNKFIFIELKENLKRLLQDYHLCCQYFGDVESFIPVDRKTDDERNPGQQRFVPDLVAVFSEFFNSYRNALKEIETEREKEKFEASRKDKKLGQSSSSGLNQSASSLSTASPIKVEPPPMGNSQLPGGALQKSRVPAPSRTTTTSSSVNPIGVDSFLSIKGQEFDSVATPEEPQMETNAMASSCSAAISPNTAPIPSPSSLDDVSIPSQITIVPNTSIPIVPNTSIPNTFNPSTNHFINDNSSVCIQSVASSSDLESITKPQRRSSLRPSLFNVGHSLPSTVLKDIDALKQLNETEDSKTDVSPVKKSVEESLKSMHESNTIIVTDNAMDLTSMDPNVTTTTTNMKKRRDSLRAISGIVHNMKKEETSISSTHAFHGNFKASQFKYFDENNPPFPGARPLPGFTTGINSLKQLHHPLQSSSSSTIGTSTIGTFHHHPSSNTVINRITSNRTALASLPESSQESEPPSPFPKSASRSRLNHSRQLTSPSSSASHQSSSTQRPNSSQRQSHSETDHPSMQSSALPTSALCAPQSDNPFLGFTRPTSASTARTTFNKSSKEEALKRIRSTILKDKQ